MEAFHYNIKGKNRRLLKNRSVRRKMQHELREAIKWDLTAKQRETVLLYYTQNLSMREIARRQNVCISTVSRSLGRAKARIDKRLLPAIEEAIKQAQNS